MPVQVPPLQPVKAELVAGVAVRVTLVPNSKLALQAAPQSTPAGVEVTVPAPVPLFATVSAKFCGVKLAVTVLTASIVTVQAAVPAQAPLQPVKVDPVPAAAVMVTLVPKAKLALQVAPQSTPAGVEVTVPVPVPIGLEAIVPAPAPALITLSATVCSVNVAVAFWA